MKLKKKEDNYIKHIGINKIYLYSGIRDTPAQSFRRKARQPIDIREIRIGGINAGISSKVTLPKTEAYYTQTVEYLHSQTWEPLVRYIFYSI